MKKELQEELKNTIQLDSDATADAEKLLRLVRGFEDCEGLLRDKRAKVLVPGGLQKRLKELEAALQ